MTRGQRVRVIGYTISVAAAQAGMHPQTLRDYERRGLIQPLRTPGGARRYRDEEITRLRRIQQLTELGLSLAAVDYVIGLEARIEQMTGAISELQDRLLQYEGSRMPVRHSTSVEIIHVPRPRRGPRWRNED